MDEKRVAVAGATGYLGGFVVRELKKRGFHVRALARSKSSAVSIEPVADEVFYGEAVDASSIAGFSKDMDVVITSIGLRTFKPRPTYEQVDYGANMNILADAEKHGVEHFIFVSVLNGQKLRASVKGVDARERVADAVRESGIRYTIARPNGFFNDMAGMFSMAGSGRFFLIGEGEGRFNPIHGADLAHELVSSISDRQRWNSELDIGGPRIYSMRQVGELAFQCLGKEPAFLSIPPALIKLSAFICQPFNANAAYVLSAMASFGEESGRGSDKGSEMIAPQFGTHDLESFFSELAESSMQSQG